MIYKDEQRGTWGFRAWTVDSDGVRRQKHRRGFARRRDAAEAERKLLSAAATAPARRLRVGPYLTDTWLPAVRGRGLRATTLDTYQRLVRAHLVPALGRRELTKLTTADVEGLLGVMAAAGLSPKSRRNVHGVLHKALSDAVRWQLVAINVASGVELPRVAPVTPRAWTMAELGRFLERAQTERLGPVWQFIAQTGCRRAEAVGVRWRDVDVDKGTVTFVNTRPIAGGSVVEGTTKSAAGARTIALDADLVTMLRSWRHAQRQELLALGLRPDGGYVFTGEDGRPLWPQRVTARFREVTDELGLPRIGPHGLRHTSVTWAIASGQNPKLVAQRHGHASSSFTIARYSHVQPGHDRAAADAFAAAIATARQTAADGLVTTVVTTEPAEGA